MSMVCPGGLRLPLKVALLCFCASTAAAQQTSVAAQPAANQQNAQGNQGADNGGRRRMTALRLNEGESITLDGRLDEPFWTRVVPAGDFMQRDPVNGQPATEPTEVRIAYDRESLYLGVTCYDSEPDKWLGYQRRRGIERIHSHDSGGSACHQHNYHECIATCRRHHNRRRRL